MRIYSITIKIEPHAGSDIKDVFEAAIRVAQVNNCIVEFVFNEVTCFARPDGDAELGSKNYRESQKINDQYKFARCY